MENNAEPLVSVIVASYNHAGYIQQCLDSIRDCKYSNIEIIIIDDGSTDNSRHVITEWIQNNKDIQVIFKSRENLGLTKTLNEMLGLASGEYICPIASDDYLLPGSIRKRLSYLREHPDKMAVFGDCIVVDENNTQLFQSGLSELHKGRIKYLCDKHWMKYELIFNWCVPGPVLFCHKGIYKRIGYYDENLLVEDLDFYLRMLEQNLLGFFEDKVAAYRVHSLNTFRNQNLALRICKSFFDTLLKNRERFNYIQYLYMTGRMYYYKARIFKLKNKQYSFLRLYYRIIAQILSATSRMTYKLLVTLYRSK